MRITLCGSTRFKKEYQEANTRLSQAGHIVYTIAWAKEDESAATPGEKMDEMTKENLDLVHLGKILNSDAVLLVHDGSRYVGASTRREIVWAQMHHKPVFYDLADILDYDNPARVNVFE
jgi:hypothetical protein